MKNNAFSLFQNMLRSKEFCLPLSPSKPESPLAYCLFCGTKTI